VIAAYILIQTQAGEANVAGPYDVIARAQAEDTGELAKLVASRVQAPGA
jgi:hypothetical protein